MAFNNERSRSSDQALLLVAVAVLIMASVQLAAMWREQASLTFALNAQQVQLDQSQKVSQQLNTLASQTAKLAAGGDKIAQVIVEDLKNRGLSITPAP